MYSAGPGVLGLATGSPLFQSIGNSDGVGLLGRLLLGIPFSYSPQFPFRGITFLTLDLGKPFGLLPGPGLSRYDLIVAALI